MLPQTRMSNMEPWFRLIGSEGEITIDADFEGGMTLFNGKHPKGTNVAVDAPRGFVGSFLHEWIAIAKAVRGLEDTDLNHREALHDIVCSNPNPIAL
jgi:hypothetical protein